MKLPGRLDDSLRGGDVLIDLLSSNGTRLVFGIVGREGAAIRFDRSDKLQFVLCRHEQCAAIMAEVAGRLLGSPQVCFVTLGPGLTNALTGIASSFKDRSPLLAIAAQAETYNCHAEVHQYLDNVELAKPITKFAAEPKNVRELVSDFYAAQNAISTGRPGPAFLSIPIDVLLEKVSQLPVAKPQKVEFGSKLNVNVSVDDRGIAKIASILNEATSPLVIVGTGALKPDISEAVRRFILMAQIPIASSLAAKGVLSNDRSLSLGAFSKYYDRWIQEGLLEQVFSVIDCILLIGFELGDDLLPSLWEDTGVKKVCRIDCYPNNVPEYLSLDIDVGTGDVAESIDVLASLVHRRASVPTFRKDILEAKRRVVDKRVQGRVNPAAIVSLIRDLSPRDTIFVCDVGMHKHISGLFLNAYEEGAYIGSNGLATMGFALPAAIGAQMAMPERRVIAICGDGGFHSVSQELEVVARYQLPLILVVFEDGAFGLIQAYQRRAWSQEEAISTVFTKVDFVKLAEANGCRARRANNEDEFKEAFVEALVAKQPYVLIVPVSYNTNWID
ncbi:MAG: acetolactate synthase large subunit [Coleofasciculaceae cyanobacterium]